jgi:uncharacterized protein (TIGR00106 family)
VVMLEFSMVPLDKGESLSPYVARVLKIVAESGVSYRLNSMGTVLEGEWDELMSVIRACHQELARDCHRISTSVKIDYRKGNEPRMDAKIASVEQKLHAELKK